MDCLLQVHTRRHHVLTRFFAASDDAQAAPSWTSLSVATPIAFLLMDKWLQNFAYHVEISWQTFVIAGIAALAVAWVAVSYHSIKAALADPVKSLRYE